MSNTNDNLEILDCLNEQQLIVLRDLLISKVPLTKQELVDLMGETVSRRQVEKQARRQSDPMATTLEHYINLFDVHDIRCEKAIPLFMFPLQSLGGSDLVEVILYDDFEGILNALEIDVKKYDHIQGTDDIEEMLFENVRQGWLIQVAKPIAHKFTENGYSSSWGYYRAKWLYHDDINELVEQAIAWAEEQHELNKRQSLEKNNG